MTWQPGDVVQLAPRPDVEDDVFGGCFMVITEPKTWGAQGYVTVPGKGQAYYRCENKHMQYIGRAVWVVDRNWDGEGEEVGAMTVGSRIAPMSAKELTE